MVDVKAGVLKLWSGCKAIFLGSRWPKWMEQCQEWVPVSLFGLSGVVGVPTGSAHGRALWLGLCVMVLIFLAGVALTHARFQLARRTSDKKEQWIEAAEAEHKSALQTLLGDELHNLLHLVAEAVATEDPSARRLAASNARRTIICAAANMVARKVVNGTRANLFRLSATDSGGRQMTLEPGAFFGRGDSSHRIFGPGDLTFERTIANKTRFVPAVSDLSDADDLQYETFLTHPVSVGVDRIHGALTVDCLQEGQIVEEVEVPMMAVLSTLIAITYECEKYPTPRRPITNRVT